jgi:hypothetical protein
MPISQHEAPPEVGDEDGREDDSVRIPKEVAPGVSLNKHGSIDCIYTLLYIHQYIYNVLYYMCI